MKEEEEKRQAKEAQERAEEEKREAKREENLKNYWELPHVQEYLKSSRGRRLLTRDRNRPQKSEIEEKVNLWLYEVKWSE